jgi:hypothetical protein
MGEQQTLFFWILASGGFGAALGAAFGAGVGAVTWLSGRAAGTFFGFRMARAFENAARYELTPGTKGALIGGTDGSVFLGAVGVVVGAVVASRTPAAWEILGPTAAALTILMGGGILFGLIALALLRTGVRAVIPLFFGAMLGAGIGLWLGRANGLLTGLGVGIAAGTLIAFLWGPRAS